MFERLGDPVTDPDHLEMDPSTTGLATDTQPSAEMIDAESLSLAIRNPSPFALGDRELYLLDYFTNNLLARCTTWPADNPFVRTLIPVCLSSPHQPLFNTIMATACHQLFLLNDQRFERDIWAYRARALRGLRGDIGEIYVNQSSSARWEQVVSTLIMFTFFDECSLLTLGQTLTTHKPANIRSRCRKAARRLG